MTGFTVVLPTRDRPALFQAALASVLAQQDAAFDVVVVNDGSAPDHAAAYAAIAAAADPRVRFIALPARPRGHGPSYAMNTGVHAATGAYVGFLDDDDSWTDPRHLARAAAVIAGTGQPDLYLANQTAWVGGVPMTAPVWVENLLERVPELSEPDRSGSYAVTAAQLLRAQGASHTNTVLFRRDFYLTLGGMDEGLRYAGDWDIFLRAIDRAAAIRYVPDRVARHNVPVAADRSNVTTTMSGVQKLLAQLQLLDKVQLSAATPAVRDFAARSKAYALQNLAEALSGAGRHAEAASYARQALALRPSPAWLRTTLGMTLRAFARG